MKLGIKKLPLQRGRRGMTLIEIMAVIVILSILMAFLVTQLGGLGEASKVQLTKAYLKLVEAAAADYETEFGDYPPSEFPEAWGAAPNSVNIGIESLVLSLWSDDWSGTSLEMDGLINMDGDSTRKEISGMLGKEVFELSDLWGNPIAYFHRRDYGREDVYMTEDPQTGDLIENTVKAVTDPRTGKYARPRRFQLISAGSDGVFGTKDDGTLDDLYNFKLK